MIITPNIEGDIAIVCGWTKKEKIENSLNDENRERIGAIGQLYSKEGINYIIRNIFLNPNIKHIIITGLDLSGSLNFFKNFLEKNDSAEDILHKEIPKEKINEFCQYFNTHCSFVEEKDISKKISDIENLKENWISQIEEFDEPKYQEASNFPSEEVGIRLEDKKIADLWLKILDNILKFGRDKMSQYGDMQRELVGLVSIVSDEDPEKPFLPEYLIFNKNDLDNYLNQMMTDKIPENLEYTYGSLLRNYKKINQIESIIEQIKKEDYTRRAVAVCWNVEKDNLNPKSPCLDLIQAIVNKNKLHLTCYFRSNDMFGAWPQNALALRNIQKEIADKVGKEMGKLMIISNSAHIYERDYEKAMEIVKKYKSKLDCEQDKRGNFVIELENDLIKVIQTDINGRAIQNFSGKTAIEIFHQIYPFLSKISHSLDLGAELQKAEIALKKKLKYIQDNELKF
jgi:thymidylate synthase